MPPRNCRRRPHKRPLHCVYVQHRHTTRGPNGNTHPLTSATISTKSRAGSREPKSDQYTNEPTPTHPPQSNILHQTPTNTQPKKPNTQPNTTSTHTHQDLPTTTQHHPSQPMQTLRNRVHTG